MDDQQIIELFWQRSENAIAEVDRKYGSYCHHIAWGILGSREDSEECVSDTWLRAWDAIPPQRPGDLATFLGKITRNLALDRYASRGAKKRGGGQLPLALEELRDCVPAGDPTAQLIDRVVLTGALNQFLASLTPEARNIFLRRYWYFSSLREIAMDLGVSESKVKMSLLRSRGKLKKILQKEGIAL